VGEVPPEVIGLTVAGVTVAVEVKSISEEPPNDGASVLTCCRLSVETGTVVALGGLEAVRMGQKCSVFRKLISKILLLIFNERTHTNIKEQIHYYKSVFNQECG
jgi:hypothetical protein